MMSLSKLIREEIVNPILRQKGFKKTGKTYHLSLSNGIVFIIYPGPTRIVEKDNFLYRIEYGIYLEGLIELMYGITFKLQEAIVDCVFTGDMVKQKIRKHWDTKEVPLIDLRREISNSLSDEIIPFLFEIDSGDKLVSLFEKDLSY